MTRVELSMVVPNSVEDTFSFLDKRESHLRFIPRITEFRQTSDGIFGQVGTTVSGILNYFGIRIPVQYEIIGVEPIQSLAMKGEMGPIHFTDGYVLNRNGKGTEIRFWLDLSPTGWAKVFSPFMGLIGRIHAWETLRNLNRELTKTDIASSLRSSQ